MNGAVSAPDDEARRRLRYESGLTVGARPEGPEFARWAGLVIESRGRSPWYVDPEESAARPDAPRTDEPSLGDRNPMGAVGRGRARQMSGGEEPATHEDPVGWSSVTPSALAEAQAYLDALQQQVRGAVGDGPDALSDGDDLQGGAWGELVGQESAIGPASASPSSDRGDPSRSRRGRLRAILGLAALGIGIAVATYFVWFGLADR